VLDTEVLTRESKDMSETPKIYVACLAAYNAGKLHGVWIDATQGEDVVEAEIEAMLQASPVPGAEEFAIHDFEGFYGLSIDENESIEAVVTIAALLEEHGALGAELIGTLGDADKAQEALAYHYKGAYASLADYAYSMFEDSLTGVPNVIANNVNWDNVGKEFKSGGDIWTVEVGGQVHVFDSN
jgi:antirestriction protein